MGSVFIWRMSEPFIKTHQSGAWQPVAATVVSCEVLHHYPSRTHGRSGGGCSISYSLDMRYNYVYNGKNYTGNLYNFFCSGGNSIGDGSMLYNIAKNHPPGSAITCWVNQENPAEAVVSRVIHRSIFILILPLIFLVIGVTVIVFTIRSALWGFLKNTPE